MLRHVVIAEAVCVLVAMMSGCATAPTEIPTGQWRGHGTFIDYEARVATDTAHQTRTRVNTRSYETFLKISKTRAYGRDAFVVSIRSERGVMFNVPGEVTQAVLGLVQLERLPNGAVLYAFFGDPLPDDWNQPNAVLPRDEIAFATLLPTGEGAVLQVGYDKLGSDNTFMDTYTFSRGHIAKSGSVRWKESRGGDKFVEVFWAEDLNPVGSIAASASQPASQSQWQAYVDAEQEAYRFASKVLKRDPNGFERTVLPGGTIYHDANIEVDDGNFVVTGLAEKEGQVVMAEAQHRSIMAEAPLVGQSGHAYGLSMRFGLINDHGRRRILLSKGTLGVRYKEGRGRWTRQYIDIVGLTNDRSFDEDNIRVRATAEAAEQDVAKYLKLTHELEARFPAEGE